MNVVIIEDEVRNQKLLKLLLSKHYPSCKVVGQAESVEGAAELILREKPDVILLDIQLKDGSGFDVLRAIKEEHPPAVIFTTAYNEYALEAFKFSAVNYLLKPIDKDELVSSLDKAKDLQKDLQISSVRLLLDKIAQKNEDPIISISGTKSTEYLKIGDIIHIQAMGAYSKIFMKDGSTHTVSKVIKVYDQMLSPHQFFRVHQSHLINLRCVKKLHKGDHTVILENGDEISISRKKKEAFTSAMNKMIL